MRERFRAKEANKKQNRYVCFGYGCCCRAQSFLYTRRLGNLAVRPLFFNVTESQDGLRVSV